MSAFTPSDGNAGADGDLTSGAATAAWGYTLADDGSTVPLIVCGASVRDHCPRLADLLDELVESRAGVAMSETVHGSTRWLTQISPPIARLNLALTTDRGPVDVGIVLDMTHAEGTIGGLARGGVVLLASESIATRPGQTMESMVRSSLALMLPASPGLSALSELLPLTTTSPSAAVPSAQPEPRLRIGRVDWPNEVIALIPEPALQALSRTFLPIGDCAVCGTELGPAPWAAAVEVTPTPDGRTGFAIDLLHDYCVAREEHRGRALSTFRSKALTLPFTELDELERDLSLSSDKEISVSPALHCSAMVEGAFLVMDRDSTLRDVYVEGLIAAGWAPVTPALLDGVDDPPDLTSELSVRFTSPDWVHVSDGRGVDFTAIVPADWARLARDRGTAVIFVGRSLLGSSVTDPRTTVEILEVVRRHRGRLLDPSAVFTPTACASASVVP